jgi:predicted amidohydrolase
MSESKVKVAAVQAAPVFLDLEASLQKALALIEKAAANGARLLVFPEAFLPAWPAWVASMRHIAREGVCHVVGVAPAARFSEVPDSVPERERLWRGVDPHGDWMLDGYSVVVDPSGTVLAGPLVREEGILYATLDLDAAHARRRLFDPVGHYNRPDVFRLVVDDRPKPHLVSLVRAEPGPAAPDETKED